MTCWIFLWFFFIFYVVFFFSVNNGQTPVVNVSPQPVFLFFCTINTLIVVMRKPSVVYCSPRLFPQQAGWRKCKLCVTVCRSEEGYMRVCVCVYVKKRGRQMDCWCWGGGVCLGGSCSWLWKWRREDERRKAANDASVMTRLQLCISHLTQEGKRVAIFMSANPPLLCLSDLATVM